MSHCSIFELRLLTIALLFLQGIQDVMTDTFFVSHHGDDLNNCGNWTTPCRTVKHAVRMSNDGDQINIDYALGRPYMECENLKQSTFSIELRKSVSFHGINGKAEIRCRKSYDLFNITSPSFNITRVEFFNLVISNSNIAVRLDMGTKSELVFQNMLVQNNLIGIYSKYSTGCSILIVNSSFEHNYPGVTHLQCFNVTAQIISSTFKLTPVLFANIDDKLSRWQNMRVWVRSTIVDGEITEICTDMFAIQPFAATLNVTITYSQFKNHLANCRSNYRISTLNIYGHNSIIRMHSNIFLSNLLIENNYNNWATFILAACYQTSTEGQIMIRDSMFRNNTAAFRVNPYYNGKYTPSKHPTIFLENNTFVDNTYQLLKPDGAAAIYFANGKSSVSSCRFLDNKVVKSPYTGVVTISEKASVTILNSYFENQQTKVQSLQLIASGHRRIQFSGYNTFNLLALNEGQSVFVRIPSAINAGVIFKKNFKILCPQGYKLKPQRLCTDIKNAIMCYYINIQCEQCPTKTYTIGRGELAFNKSNNIQCQQCPRGGNCDSGLVIAKPNFWGYKTKMKVLFVQCPPGYCCESEDCDTYHSCHGNRSGTLCGQCPEGMSESLFSTQCISNTKCALNYFSILAIIALFVLYLLFFLCHKEILSFLRTSLFTKRLSFSISRRKEQLNNFSTDGNASSSCGLMKIFFYYYQVCNLLRGSVGSFNGNEFMNNFENAISRVMNMVLVSLPSFNCPLKNTRPVPKTFILHSVGYCLLGLLCFLHLLGKLFLMARRLKRGSDRRTRLQYIATRSDQGSESPFSKRVVSAFTYISLLMYASSAQLCLSLLHCVPVGEDLVLFIDGNIKCYQTFQYFLLAYMISSILLFCFVPVLGSYLLKLHRIGVKQFCAACIFPLPFCCFWMYLLLKNSCCGNQGTIQQNNDAVREDQANEETQSLNNEEITFGYNDSNEITLKRNESAILAVLLGPFRPHQAFACFPASHIPWEGFLIFRRLVLIIVLTFVYDIQLRLFLALALCVIILIFHMFVNPFQRKRDNVLESFSLGTHVVLCGLTLVKALYYGEDYSFSKSLPLMNVVENILIVAPLLVIIIVVILCILVKLAFGLKFCVSVFIRNIRRLV